MLALDNLQQSGYHFLCGNELNIACFKLIETSLDLSIPQRFDA